MHRIATAGRLSVVFAATVALLPFGSRPARLFADREVTVAEGDTLTAIALMYFGDAAYAQRIADYNQLTDPDHLAAGQVLKLPDAAPATASVLTPPSQPSSTSSTTPTEPRAGPVIQTGLATWYGPGFDGNRTKCGQIFSETDLTASSNDLPCGTVIQVTDLDNGRQVTVTVDDTGGFQHPDILDLSAAAFQSLDTANRGVIDVSIARMQSQ